MIPGGRNENPMNSKTIKDKHDAKMRTEEVRKKISKSLSDTLKKHGRSDEYRKKLSEVQKDRQCFKKGDKITYTSLNNTEKIEQLLSED